MQSAILPIATEIPLFHVLNAKITFGNINAKVSSVTGVQGINDVQREITEEREANVDADDQEEGFDDQTVRCTIDSVCFDAPAGYRVVCLDEPARKY